MATPLRSLVLVSVILYFGLATAAQQTAPPPANQNEPPPAIRSQTNLVLVRVVVRDTEGKPVTGLSKADFQLFDNKKPQTIAYFLTEGPEGVPAAGARLPASTDKSPAGAPPTASILPQRFTAIFFDDYHLGLGNLEQIRDAAKRYLSKSLDRGARVAIDSASGKIHVDFTNDRDKLEQAVSQLQFDGRLQPVNACPSMNDYQAELIAEQFQGGVSTRIPGSKSAPSEPEDPMDVGSALAVARGVSTAEHCPKASSDVATKSTAQYIVSENAQRAEIALAALDHLVQRMAQTPGGERTIAMVSQGFLDEKLQPQMDALIDRALRAKVIINALDAMGLYRPEGTDVEAALLPNLQTAYDQLQLQSVAMDADVMAQAAEGTGGIFIKNDNDFEGGLAKMSAAATTYVLGFSPGDLKFDGKFHTLKVTLANSERLRVQARRGYFAPKQAEDAATAGNEELERAIFSEDQLTELPAKFGARFTKADAQTTNLSVTAQVDVRSLRFRSGGGVNLDDVTLALAVFDGDGNYVTGQKKTVNMHVPDAKLKDLDASEATFAATAVVDVKPGRYVLRAVLQESASERLAAASQNIRVP